MTNCNIFPPGIKHPDERIFELSFQQSCLCSHKEMRFLQQLLLHTKLSPKLANIIMTNINFTIVQGTTILVKASSLLKKTDTQNLVQALTRVRHCVVALPTQPSWQQPACSHSLHSLRISNHWTQERLHRRLCSQYSCRSIAPVGAEKVTPAAFAYCANVAMADFA